MITYKPAPARALNSQSSGIKLFNKVLGRAKIMLDSVLQGTILENPTVALDMCTVWSRREVLPEEGVVDVTTAVETKGRLKGDALFRGSCPGVVILCGIEGVDVCLVMLVMV